MTTEGTDYTLSINVHKDVVPLVRRNKYKPVVEILQQRTNLKLTKDEKVEWVEVSQDTTVYPEVDDQESYKPTLLEDGDGNGQFHVGFVGPSPDSKEIWFAVHKTPQTGTTDVSDEDEQQTSEGADDADKLDNADQPRYKMTQDKLGKAWLVNDDGVLSPIDDKAEHHGILDENSICIINDVRIGLRFWILPKGTEKSDLDFGKPSSTFEWLPGSGRIQLPPTTGKGLQVRVWLQASSSSSQAGITFQQQTQKTLVPFVGDATVAEATINSMGLWADEGKGELSSRRKTRSKLAISDSAEPASPGPQTLPTRSFTNKRPMSNGTAPVSRF